MTDYYANWKARLAGTAVKTYLQPQLEDAGYYRQPTVRKLPNGQTETLGWAPVALWVENAELFGLIGIGGDMRELRDDELAGEQLWSWICRNPISYEVYKAVAEDGQPWPDAPETQLANTMGETVPAANREVTSRDNRPPEEDNRPAYEIAAEKIKSAAGVADAHEVTDQKSAEQALGIVNRLAELRLKAKRDGEAEYKPLYNQYKTLLDAWKPPQDMADAAEKRLTAKISSWKRAEEKRLKEEAAKAEAERKRLEEEALARSREQEEAAARAMDRAIANGEAPATMEMPFEVEMPEPVATAPAPVATTVALAPTYGKRKLRETPKEPVFTITDYDAVYNHFKNLASVKALLDTLVKAAVKSNITVPGVTVTKEEE